MALGFDGSIRIDTKIDTKGFSSGIKSLGSSLTKLAGIIGVAFGTAAIINFGKEAVNAASQLQNAWMGLESIVEGQGRSFSKAQSFINDYISDGLVPLENAVTSYKNLAARGYDDEQIQKTLVALKDAAAFGRQASYSLGDAVTSATEGLKNENSILVDNAGVTKNVAKMWDDYAKSIGTTANNLTQQQKIQAEVNGILEETKFQTGDAALLTTTYSGQISLLAFNFQQLKVAVGNAIMPIVQAVLPGINAIISALTKLANVFAQVTALLFGKSTGLSKQASTQKEIATTGGAAAAATDKLADATEGAGTAAKKAEKDMKGVLASFDELNILATSAEDSVSGAAGGIDSGISSDLGIDEFETGGELFGEVEINPELEKGIQRLKDAIQALIERVKELRDIFLEGFKFSFADVDFSGILEDLQKIGGYLGDIFSDSDVQSAVERFVDSFVFMLGSMAGYFASVGATIAQLFVGGIEKFLSENSERIKEWLIRIFDVGTEINELLSKFMEASADVFSVFGEESAQSIVASILQIFSDAFMLVTELAVKIGRDIIDLITTPFVENKDKLKEAIRGFLEPIAEIMNSIKETVRMAVDEIVKLYDEHIHPFIMKIKESFTEWFELLLDGWNEYINPVLSNFAEKFDEVVTEHVQPMIEKAIEFIGKLFDALSLLWENILSPLVSWIIENAMPNIANALDFIGEVFNTLLATVSDVVGGIIEALGGVIDFITGVFTGDWELAWEGVKNIFKGIFNAIVATLEGAINLIIKGINFLIGKLNLIKIDMPDWVEDTFGVGSIGFNVSKIQEVSLPRLANGAVIPPNQQFAAILGDQRSGKNIEAPASLIKQMVSEALRESSNLTGNETITVVVNLDGREVARNQVKHINNMTRAAGKPVLLI